MRIFALFIIVIHFASYALHAQIEFESPVEYNIGPSPQALKAGDFNNDGWPDIVSANGTFMATKHVSLALNNQSGGFNITNLTALKGYYDLETAFFNNDANLDFVASSLTLDQVTIFLGNGDGTFNTADINVGDGPLDILTGDFNEDTNTDIAVLHQSSDDIYILYGDGSGSFGGPQIIPVDVQSSYFTTADFNNDNHADLAVGANTTLNFYAGDGAGNFAAAAPTTGFFGFDYLTAADIDADGNMDVVGAGSTLAFTVAGAGNGTFSAPTFLSEGGLAAITGDFDDDGNLDVASTRKGKVIYYPGDGSGSFLEYRRMQIGGGKGMVVSDWDKDGNLDIATAGTFSSSVGHLLVTFGKGNGYFSAHFEYPVPNNPEGLTSGDFDEDGLEDLALVASGSLSVYKGHSNGTFMKINSVSAGTTPLDIEALHINADTHIDLAVLDFTGSAVILFSGDGTGAFTPTGNFAVTANFEMTANDVNKDGNTDIILAGGISNNVQVFQGNGDGTFSLLIDIDLGEVVRNVMVSDVNEDTNPDLAILYSPVAGPRKIGFYQGNGSGGFTPAGANLDLPGGGQTFTKGDFNNDGHIDFLSLGSDGDIYTGNGDFSFNYSSTNTGVSLVEHSTEVADFDGDGFVDLISVSDCSVCTNGGRIQINRGTGDGTFSASFWSETQIGGYRLVVSDFNDDGSNDIATLVNNNDFDGLSILLNTVAPPPCDVPDITVGPIPTTLCEGGDDYVLLVSATGTPPLTYQWQIDGTDIPGAPNSSSFTLSNYSVAESGSYRCVITNNCGSDVSSSAVISIVEFSQDPTTVGAAECGAVSVTLTASGTTDGNYRWYDVSTGGDPIPGAVNGDFITPVLTATTDYYVSIINAACESNRVIATASITNPIVLVTEPVDVNADLGDDITFTVVATGDNIMYQWKKDGTILPGETASSLTITNVSETDVGSYTCNIFNDCGSVVTNEVNLSLIITDLKDSLSPITIYPNPSTGILYIKNNLNHNLQLSLYSVQGNLVYSSHVNNSESTHDLRGLPTGIYYLLLYNSYSGSYRKISLKY